MLVEETLHDGRSLEIRTRLPGRQRHAPVSGISRVTRKSSSGPRGRPFASAAVSRISRSARNSLNDEKERLQEMTAVRGR
jgi:hypothetical protein